MANEENTFLDNVVELGASLLVGYAISRFVRVALARGESMLPTIHNNQPIILDCRAYHRRLPKRHDLIAFKAISRFVRVALARGESMLPTIHNNQPIILDCRAYHRRLPKRHDLIAFKAHQKKQHKFFLKRVIGLPGEHIVIEKGKLFIDGVLTDEPYIKEPMNDHRKIDLIVDEGYLFVMGDNRNHSLDSRSSRLGLVKIEKDVVGVVKQFRK